jgi:hypothetical protein
MPAALEVEHLTRRFGRTLAVDDLSLTIEAGSTCPRPVQPQKQKSRARPARPLAFLALPAH